MATRRAIERAWRRKLEKAQEYRARNPPPPPGTLKEGDICPCGCGGTMTMVDGVLSAITMDVVASNGRMFRL